MQLRRIILALALSATVGLTAGCAQDSKGTDQGASPAGGRSSTGAASPTADLKANTEAVCKGVVAAYDAEKTQLAAALGELIAASALEDKAALATAKAKGAVVVDRLTKAVNAELAKAADPQAKAALEKFVATFGKVLTGDGLDDPAYEAEMEKATNEAAKYCPALAD